MHLLCDMVGHKPDKKKVWHDGLDFRCPCRRCGQPMIRDLDGWRIFDSATDLAGSGRDRIARPDLAGHGQRLISR